MDQAVRNVLFVEEAQGFVSHDSPPAMANDLEARIVLEQRPGDGMKARDDLPANIVVAEVLAEVVKAIEAGNANQRLGRRGPTRQEGPCGCRLGSDPFRPGR